MQNELQNGEDEDDDESSSVQSNSLLTNYDKTAIGSPKSGEKFEKLNPFKNKQQTVVKR